MARRKKPAPAKPATPPPSPSLETLLAAKAASDPHAWEAMLNLNKMRSARRQQEKAVASRPPTKDRD